MPSSGMHPRFSTLRISAMQEIDECETVAVGARAGCRRAVARAADTAVLAGGCFWGMEACSSM